MPARCGVQKKSRNFALSGGGHDRLRPLVGKSADLPVSRRAGKFARFALADVQMRRCAGMQISRRRGTRGMLLYIRIRAHTHARTSCILRRYCVHSTLTKRFYLIINAFRCVGRWNFYLHGNYTRQMRSCKHNYGRADFRYRERKCLTPPTEISAWHDRFFCLPLQEMHTHACWQCRLWNRWQKRRLIRCRQCRQSAYTVYTLFAQIFSILRAIMQSADEVIVQIVQTLSTRFLRWYSAHYERKCRV